MYGIILALKLLIIILSIAIILIIMLLTIPYNYVIKGDIREKFKVRVQVNWLWGIFKIICFNLSDQFQMKIYFMNLCIYSSLGTNSSVYIKNNTDINKKIKINFKNLDLNVLKLIVYYLKDIFFILKPSTFNIKGVYGLEDPFLTGTISSIVSIIKLNLTAIKIDISPVFDKIILNILIKIKGRVFLFKLIFVSIKVLRQKELRKFILTRV